MKKWAWWGYLAVVHVVLIWLAWYFVWISVFSAGLPVRFEWLSGPSGGVPGLGLSEEEAREMAGTMRVARLRVGGEAVGMLLFEERELTNMYFRWPGESATFSLSPDYASLNPLGTDVLSPGPDEGRWMFFDGDGDRVFDIEDRSDGREREWSRIERNMLWRHDLETDAYEIFGRDGELTARVSPDPADAEMVVVERIEDGEVISSERIREEDHDFTQLVQELNPRG